jgi:digeranylgeranylglycerophospholipid reductase
VDKSKVYDVIVIGAGPAGSTTAKYAARCGLNVLLVDKREQIGIPVRCGEYMPALNELRIMFPDVEDLDELFEIVSTHYSRAMKGTYFYTPGKKVYKLDFKGFTVDRQTFDLALAQQAQAAGAVLLTNTTVTQVKDNHVFTDKGEFSAKVIVGADGPLSLVANCTGMRKPRRLAVAIRCDVEGDFGDVVKMYFGEAGPGGYAWIFPKKNSANIGLGIQTNMTGMSLNELLKRFLEAHGMTIEQAKEVTVKAIPVSGQVPQLVKENVLLVGDAAGHVMPCNGGGLPVAMICGRLAGWAIVAHITQGLPLTLYGLACQNQVGNVLRRGLLLKRIADICFHEKHLLEWSLRLVGAHGMHQILRCQFPFMSKFEP